MSCIGLTRYTVRPRYMISWRRPDGTRLPRLTRTTNSCMLDRRAFTSLVTTLVKELRPRRLVSRLAALICQEGEGTSVTSAILQQYIEGHFTCTRY
jgi:hypothetical protein